MSETAPQQIPRAKDNFARCLGFCILAGLLAVLGHYLIPRHWTSIWFDHEFTDWISPIANRLHGGAVLYTQGTHSPMPPLPYVLVRVLHPGGATWIQENFLHFIFQAGTILLLFYCLARHVQTVTAFVSCLIALPIFFSLEKTMLYDSLVQFLVVCSGIACAGLVQLKRTQENNLGTTTKVSAWKLPLLGFVLGLTMLAKQSTGLGALIGSCVALLFLPSGGSFRRRCGRAALVIVYTGLAVVVISLLMGSLVNFPGMIHDVFLRGSEPKGGGRKLIFNLGRIAIYVAEAAGVCAAAGLALATLVRGKTGLRNSGRLIQGWINSPLKADEPDVGRRLIIMTVAAIFCVACFMTLQKLPALSAINWIPPAVLDGHLVELILNIGLFACLALMAGVFIGKPGRESSWQTHPLAPYVITFFFAAVFHNLSVRFFRWTYDNNPLIVIALVFLLGPLLDKRTAKEKGWKNWGLMARLPLVCALAVVAFCSSDRQLKVAAACTETWPEVRHLAGAKLRPEAGGMRNLVNLVRANVDSSRHETVLLLPNDPNVEAWFERDNPVLSSSVIFADQYWDRYVDEDFARLRENPPKVIVIGPRNWWRRFGRVWKTNQGVERLIDLVTDKLLPQNYKLEVQEPITFNGQLDYMDVYVRHD